MKFLWLLVWHGQSLPLFPKELYCSNASVRLRMQDTRQGGVIQADIPCDSRAFGRKSTCCNAEDVTMVMEHLQHTMDFGMRHLTDRKEFSDQYNKVSLQQHPCGEAPEAMLRMRLEKLLECQQISEEVLGLLQATVSHLLCAACRGGVESNAALMVDAEVALSDEWKRLSVATQKIYQEIRAHDAAIAGQMRQVGAEPCVMDFIEAQRRGVPAHGTHVMKIRPWHSGEGLGGFQETWERYIDGLLGLSTELAESIMAEVTGLLLSFQHALEPSPAQQLLCGVSANHYSQKLDLWQRQYDPPKEDAAEMTLLVAMPNPTTNLRFDFANDKGTLSKDSLLKHVSALNPLLDKMAQGAPLKLVLVTTNPDQASYLQRLIANHDRVRLVWRRFALFNSEELAVHFAGPSQMDVSRVVAAFQVKPAGDASELHAAATLMAQLLGSTSAKIVWPPNLHPAGPSHWPELVHSLAARPGVAFRAARPGEGPCPELVPILKDYLDFHRSARAKLLEQATTSGYKGPLPRMLIYRCSAMGFCGGHGDRLNGLLSVFLMAVASRRAFFIDAARPVPMHLLLHPRRRPDACGAILEKAEFLLDWRTHGAVALTGRRTNYNDRYNDLVAELPWILGQEEEQVVVMHSNQRVTAAVLQSPEAQALMGPTAKQLLGRPYLHAAMLELLFEPSELLAQRHQEVLEAALLGRRKLIAVHFRAGDQSPQRWSDPRRHGLGDLDAFLACAQGLEQRHRWKDSDVAWYLAADTAEVGSSSVVNELIKRGKLAFLPGDQDAAIIHLDRSPLPIAVMGLTDTWAQWLTIASADAVILSASNFGVTAAEAGRVPLAYLGANGCLESDLTAI